MTGSTDSSLLPDRTSVVIAGGGPSGLFLAADLARRGVDSVVLEPRLELDWLHPRAKTTNARTMTHLRRIGIADRLRESAPLSPAWSDAVIFCTSLAGREITRFANAFQLRPGRYDVQPECGQQVAQPVVEQVLRATVQSSHLAHLALATEFVSATELGQGVEAVVRDSDGAERSIRASYLVGADGVSSTVRRGLGVRLVGSSAAKSNLGILFRSEQLAERVRLDPAVQYWIVGQTYAGMVGTMDRAGLWWSIVQGYDPAAPHFAAVDAAGIVRSLIGVDVDVEVLAEDPWTARMLLAPTYRVGRTFLVGDAAHANPPWGGHGFNTCVGDAANLAWKLAAAVHGWAGPELLDSYQAERRPVARRTIDEAETNGSVLADDVMDPDLESDSAAGEHARARAAAALQVKESEFHSLGLVLGYHYGDSPLVSSDGGRPPRQDPVRYEASAAPGCVLPHAWLDERMSLYDVLGPGFTILVDQEAGIDLTELRAVVTRLRTAGIPVSLESVRSPGRAFAGSWRAPVLLVRPDQHVAWRGSDADDLAAAVHRAAGRLVGCSLAHA
jgi:2-polyprenyl-6-methoxyphenol hydroxylase-like FAD-dependent oxidoreductase